MRSFLRRFWRGESGQDLTEWALLLALVTIGSAALMRQSGGSISGVWTAANLTLQGPSTSSPSGGGGTGSTGSTGTTGSHRRGTGGWTGGGGDGGSGGRHRYDGGGR